MHYINYNLTLVKWRYENVNYSNNIKVDGAGILDADDGSEGTANLMMNMMMTIGMKMIRMGIKVMMIIKLKLAVKIL